MVLQKRLDYGFQGYQFPPTPRAARSARRRCSFKKKHEDNQVCAFDLLALVAGKLLLERQSASKGQLEVVNTNSVKEDKYIKDEEKPLKVETHDPPSPRGSFVIPDRISQVHEQNHSPRESVYSEDDLNLGLASAVTSDLQEKSKPLKLVSGASKNEVEMIGCNVETGPPVIKKTSEYKVGPEMNRPAKDEHQKIRKVSNGALVNTSSGEDPKVPSFGKHLSPSSYPAIQGDVNLVSRDDDENSSGCTYTRTIKKHLRPAPRIGDRRIKKILASRYWKVSPRLKEATLANGDGTQPIYHNKKNYYKPQRSEKIYPLKKRKYFQCSSPSPSTSDGAISSEFVSGSARKGRGRDTSGCCQKMHEGTKASSSITAENIFQATDSHVKLRIKSFRVPELFIEIPESATVGSLKRSVMEAVTAILGGGLRVGVLLQGKKVRDDNKTLVQSGISHDNQLDSVGFSLEPTPSKVAPSLRHGVSPFLLPSDSPQPLSRYPPSPLTEHHGTCTSPDPHGNTPCNVESDHDSAPSPVDMSIDKSTTDSKALVAVPAVNVDALALVPAHRKSKRCEIVQRRIRRPFSVTEVEALVQAVEKLGTGRWRDVKLRAFDNAKHRTYVDLKDKWKTLVHTARISPQQRRGEPVPQELLDRVLTAHAYWSQHQAKQQQQVKHHSHPSQPETFLLV